MWEWVWRIVGIVGVSGAITAAVIFIPGAAEVALNVLAAVVRAVASTASWCLRQAMATPAWTGVMAVLAVVVVLGWGNIEHWRGDSDGYARGIAVGADDLVQSRHNTDTALKGLDKCNASVIGMDIAAKKGQAESAKLIAALQTERDRLKANRAKGDIASPSAQICPSVDAIMGEYSK
jgi:uncharacterized small protein (DUF1192 family)